MVMEQQVEVMMVVKEVVGEGVGGGGCYSGADDWAFCPCRGRQSSHGL